MNAVAQAHAHQRFARFRLIRQAVEILSQHHVFKRRQVRYQVELLEDEADLFGAETREVGGRKPADFLATNPDGTVAR